MVRAAHNLGTIRRDAYRHIAKGFSLIELVVCMGIVMILVGLLLPGIASARRTARDVREVAFGRSNAQLIALYARDHDDLYPRWSDEPVRTSFSWWVPILRQGYAASPFEVDPDFRAGQVEPGAFHMSMAMVYPPELMAPGSTVPPARQRSADVRQSDVLFTSGKGLLQHNWGRLGTRSGPWCCLPGVEYPFAAAFADGSAARYAWTQLYREYPFTENGIGTVVFTTWHGVRGRDR